MLGLLNLHLKSLYSNMVYFDPFIQFENEE